MNSSNLPKTTVAFDTETTGIIDEVKKDFGDLIQIGLVKENGSSMCRYFLPYREFTDKALATHGMNYEKLRSKGAKPFTKDDANEIVDFIGPNPRIIAHNFEFDKVVLFAAFKRVGVYLPYD